MGKEKGNRIRGKGKCYSGGIKGMGVFLKRQ